MTTNLARNAADIKARYDASITPPTTICPLLKEVCAYGFSAVDLQLFLDVNPSDTKAIAMYNEMVAGYEKAKAAYEKKYGPLRSFVEPSNPKHFDWVNSPWPWGE